MTHSTNFDTSTTGINIEVTAFQDGMMAQEYFNENLTNIKDSLFIYNEGGEKADAFDLKNLIYKENLVSHLKEFLRDDDATMSYYEPAEINKMLKDELVNLVDTIFDEMSLDEASELAYDNGLTIGVHGYTEYTTRGYSQGDYAKVLVPDALVADWMQDNLDHLFWDCPLYMRIEVNGEEWYPDVHDHYDYDKEEIIKLLLKDFNVDEVDEITKCLPDELEYV